MNRIEVKTGDKYDVLVGNGLIPYINEFCGELLIGKRVLIVCGENVARIYLQKLIEALEESSVKYYVFCHHSGEKSKSPETLVDILNYSSECGLNRSDIMIALGGGVTGDLTGLAASLYMRGIKYIQIPTTLLAMTDSSVGGKTAVNLASGKNLMGAFYQPAVVLCDVDCLNTLPKRILSEGMAEVIKYAFISGNKDLLSMNSIDLVTCCVEYKRNIVEEDEKDFGGRRILNFGHTFGHAIEKCSDFSWLHGEAVAAGMAIMTRGSEKLGICNIGVSAVLEDNLLRHNLPMTCSFSRERIKEYVGKDKKAESEGISVVLPIDFGKTEIKKMSIDEIMKIYDAGVSE